MHTWRKDIPGGEQQCKGPESISCRACGRVGEGSSEEEGSRGAMEGSQGQSRGQVGLQIPVRLWLLLHVKSLSNGPKDLPVGSLWLLY